MDNLNEIRDYLNKQDWIFAKTYADKAPHEYIVREKAWGTDREFADSVLYIREHGIPMMFWGSEYIYLYLDGRLYWTTEESVEDTIILNRCDRKDCEITVRPVVNGVVKEGKTGQIAGGVQIESKTKKNDGIRRGILGAAKTVWRFVRVPVTMILILLGCRVVVE